MNLRSPKIIFLLGIAALALGIASYTLSKLSGTENKDAAQEQTTVTEPVPYSEREWLTYTDDIHGYRIDYPSGLNIYPFVKNDSSASGSENDLEEDGGVSFSPRNEGPGIMGVKVYVNPLVSSLDEWLDFQNQRGRSRVDKEKTVLIAGQEAWVTYPVYVSPGFEEPFFQEKKTAFFKDGILFEIWTRFYDDESAHVVAWESFGFLN